MSTYTIDCGDCIEEMQFIRDKTIQCCVTSPPYFGLRDYGVAGQIGLEPTPDEFVQRLVDVFREVRRVLRDDGTLWLNLGDSYSGSGPSGASYQSKTTQAREGKNNDGAFRISKTLGARGLTYADKKPIPTPGLKAKDLIGIPWRVAFALQADGWYLRQDIIWHKPNPMPESVRDRCTKAHEYVFLLSKSQRYYFDSEAMQEPAVDIGALRRAQDIREPSEKAIKGRSVRVGIDTNGGGQGNGLMTYPALTRNKRSVWTVATKPYKEAHFATFPPKLIEPCILAGSRPGDSVLDPFAGSGTTGEVALQHRRNATLVELNPEYIKLIRKRLDPLVKREIDISDL